MVGSFDTDGQDRSAGSDRQPDRAGLSAGDLASSGSIHAAFRVDQDAVAQAQFLDPFFQLRKVELSDLGIFPFIHIDGYRIQGHSQGEEDIVKDVAQEEIDLQIGVGSEDRIRDRNIHDALMVHGKDIILIRIDLFQAADLDGKFLIY